MWLNGSITGYGKFKFSSPDNKVYIGQFYNGDMYGFGQIFTDNFNYQGMIKNGKFDGHGLYEEFYNNDRKVFKGIFKEGNLVKVEERLNLSDPKQFIEPRP